MLSEYQLKIYATTLTGYYNTGTLRQGDIRKFSCQCRLYAVFVTKFGSVLVVSVKCEGELSLCVVECYMEEKLLGQHRGRRYV